MSDPVVELKFFQIPNYPPNVLMFQNMVGAMAAAMGVSLPHLFEVMLVAATASASALGMTQRQFLAALTAFEQLNNDNLKASGWFKQEPLQ